MTATSDDEMFPGRNHDHGECVAASLTRAEAACAMRNARLTPNRRAVLEILLADHKPLGAYDIADRIRQRGRRTSPVQVYRSLELFQALGLVHRIESLNAYLACNAGRGRHGAQFLVCEDCGRVAETSDRHLEKGLHRLAREANFVLRAPVVEIKGLCPECA